jgi:Fe(3+) dicitrate transport protein
MKSFFTYHFIAGLVLVFFLGGFAQQSFACKVSGVVVDSVSGKKMEGVRIAFEGQDEMTFTDSKGKFCIDKISNGEHEFTYFIYGYKTVKMKVNIDSAFTFPVIRLPQLYKELSPVEIRAQNENVFSLTRLNPVEGTAIYAGKKNEVVLLSKTDANLATNNSRQIYARVAGLNIWESDGAGLQLGIGGRGLNPNRTSNFNTRQNGYDISADALGYPESYYTPPSEMIDRIEVIRGASSLQYGTQFGGVVNFVLKRGSETKPFELNLRQTAGSFGLYNSFLSVGGTKGKLNYYAAYQFKTGDGWRKNSGFTQHTSFVNLIYNISEKLDISLDYTYMTYLAQQPGGLTDAMFNADPRQSIRERNWFQVKWNLAALSLNYTFSPKTQLNIRNFGLLASRDAVGFLGNITRTDPGGMRDLVSGTFKNIGNETRFLHRYKIKNKPGVILIGGRFYKGQTDNKQGLSSNGNDPYFEFINPEDLEGSDYRFPSMNLAFFGENIFYLNENLTITPGFRLEYIQTASSGYYKEMAMDLAGNIIYEENIHSSSDRRRWVPLGGVGIGYKMSKSVESYANISRNYRAINFSDLQIVNPNYRINPEITDEYGFTADGGIRGSYKDKFVFDVSVFYISYKNRIGEVLKTDYTNLQVYRYRTNIGDSYNRGIEAFAETNILSFFKDSTKNALLLFSNISFIDARYLETDEKSISNNKVEQVPAFTIRSGISFRSNSFSCSYQFSYTGEQYTDATNAEFSSNAVSGIIPSYWVMDFSLSYTRKYFRIETGVNNLTDNYYFTRRASGYPGPGILPSDGRNFYVTLQLKVGTKG